MPLLVHGEVTDAGVDVFDRERVFVERVLAPLIERFAGLKIVMEHITTREAARVRCRGVAAALRPPSRRTICCSTATRCSRAACSRIITACRSSSARSTAWLWCTRRRAAARSSSSAPTARRTRATPRRRRAAVRASTPRTPASSSMPKPLPPPARSSKLDAFAGGFGAEFYGLPVNREKITLVEESAPCAARDSRSEPTRWCHFGPEAALRGD